MVPIMVDLLNSIFNKKRQGICQGMLALQGLITTACDRQGTGQGRTRQALKYPVVQNLYLKWNFRHLLSGCVLKSAGVGNYTLVCQVSRDK